MITVTRICPKCGSEIPADAPEGGCPGCLLESGLRLLEEEAVAEGADLGHFDKPARAVGRNERLAEMLGEMGDYELLEEVGRGGQGVVFRARQKSLNRTVALKIIGLGPWSTEVHLKRFRREAEAAASLDHPGFVPIYEVGERDGSCYFSMKFVDGGHLDEIVRRTPISTRQAAQLIARIARTVHYAHEHGILHRDIKPGNILLDKNGEPHLTDFGLARLVESESTVTRTLEVLGTPSYMAPEQAAGNNRAISRNTDVYGLGAVLYHLLTGQPPFAGGTTYETIRLLQDTEPRPPRQLNPKVDRDLSTICLKCLDKDPQRRYPSALALAEELERWLEGRPIVARPISPPERVWRWSKRNPKLAASVAACAVLVAVAGTLQFQNRLTSRESAMAMHSVVVEPLLDLDTAQPDSKLSSEIAKSLQTELSKHGPARVMSVSDNVTKITSGGLSDEDSKSRWQGARTALQGTKRIKDGKLRLSLRLVNAADGKVLYRRIVESDVSGKAADTVAKLTSANIYAILSTTKPSPIQSTESDPAWRDENTRELLIAGKAVMDRRTVVDLDRAIELFEKAANAKPRSALAQSYLALAHYARGFVMGDKGSIAAASASAKTAVELNPQMHETHKALSCVLYQQGRFRESLEEAFTAYELADSNSPSLTSEVANNLRILGDPARAAAWYRIAKTSRPGPNEFMVADCLADLADDENAATTYRRFWTLFPEQPEGWMGLCRLALLQRDFATARKISSENWTRYRDSVFSEEMVAQVEFFSRNFAEAEKFYQELAAKDPSGVGAFYGAVSYQSALGRLRIEAGDKKTGNALLEEALNKEVEALRSAPNHPEILYRLAAIESSLGRVEPAVEHLRAATQAGWIDYRSLDLDPRFDALRSDHRYQEIFGSMVTRVASLRAEQSPAK